MKNRYFAVPAWVPALVVLASGVTGCSKDEPPADEKLRLGQDNVLLITLDTTRADHIGCLGYEKAGTPNIDGLANGGVLFTRGQSQVCLTLPSHSSIMTGRYPREHGIRVNGRNALGREIPTLAEIFGERGYATAAFIAAIVLERQYGLARGFDHYGDNLSTDVTLSSGVPERRGDRVTEEALGWFNELGDEPFFAWVHYYDAHDPYDPPPPYDTQYEHPYDGEIAFADAQVGRLLDWLKSSGRADNTLVVLVADHGEAFGEHGVNGHTMFAHQAELHVPMLFHYPKKLRTPRVVDAVVELVDVFPTLLELAEVQPPPDLLSRSLVPALLGEEFDSVASYGENSHMLFAYQWSPQRSLVTDRWKYIATTKPELYDLEKDPGETKNLVADDPEVAKALRDQLIRRYNEMTPKSAAADLENDPAARKAMESLGYTGSGSTVLSDDFLVEGAPDPKDMLEVYEQIRDALALERSGKHAQAATALAAAVEASPLSVELHYMLGRSLRAVGRHAEAVKSLQQALTLDPMFRNALDELRDSLFILGRGEEAIPAHEHAIMLSAGDAGLHTDFAGLLRKLGKIDRAYEEVQKAIEIDDQNPLAWFELSVIERAKGNDSAAQVAVERAIAADPNDVDTAKKLAEQFARDGDAESAERFVEVVISEKPPEISWFPKRAAALLEEGETEAAEIFYQCLTDHSEAAAAAHQALGDIAMDRGDEDVALKHYSEAVKSNPSLANAAARVAEDHMRRGDAKAALELLEPALAATPDSALVKRTLAILLSQSGDVAIRDGRRALSLATDAVTATKRKDPHALYAQASAQAEVGDFDAALKTANAAIIVAELKGEAALQSEIESRLPELKAGEPLRSDRF